MNLFHTTSGSFETMCEFDLASFASGLVGAAITAAGVVYAARQLKLNAEQHRSSENWKRIEYASQLVERLSNEEELAFCARALDWGIGPLIIPQKYRLLFANGQLKIEHNWEKLAKAVQPRLDPKGLDPELLVYRYCFDTFGGYLETISRHLKLGTVDKEHLVGLGYFLDILVDAPYYAKLESSMKLKGITEKDVFTGFFKVFYPDALPLLADAASFPGARTSGLS